MASNVEVTANGIISDISTAVNAADIKENQLTTKDALTAQSSQYYSTELMDQPGDSTDPADYTDSSSESEYEDAPEHPIPFNGLSPERTAMPLEDYLEEKKVAGSPEIQERHSTLPSDVTRPLSKTRSHELRASRSDPNLRENVSHNDISVFISLLDSEPIKRYITLPNGCGSNTC